MLLLECALWASCVCFSVHGRLLSRPDLNPLQLTIRTNELSADDTDLIFVTPHVSAQNGPVIYNLRGELIWDGLEPFSSLYRKRATNLHTIQYQGSTHLVYTSIEVDEYGLISNIAHEILNSSYANTAAFTRLDASMELDPHDHQLLDNGKRFLQAAKITHASESGSRNGLEEAVIQEVEPGSSEIVFEWRSLDHVSTLESCSSYAEQDYFHINSVQKDTRGNYLANGYNVCKTYYINGSTGAIMWTLGGSNPSFSVIDINGNSYELKHMHHTRIQPLSLTHLPDPLKATVSNSTHLALSLFDNAFDATASLPTAPSSSALILLLDLRTHIARIIERYPHPLGLTAAMFGSLSLLPNGDRFIGWGSGRDMSQHTRSGRLIFHAEIGTADTLIGSFRAFKAPWIGRPSTRPDVYAYAWGCQWRSAVYVSWNGATEVRSYRVFEAQEGARSVKVAEMEKEGFETRIAADRYVEYVFVEALDAEGGVLGRSDVVRTYRPPPVEARGCSEWMCPATLRLPRDKGSCGRDGYADAVGVEGQALLG